MLVAAVTEDAYETVRALAPVGVEVRRMPSADDGVEAAREVAFLVPASADAWLVDRLGELPSLRVVQVLSAGTDWIEERVPEGVTLCNARGARDVSVAEWVVAALLGATSGLLEAGRERRWRYFRPAELAGWTVLVLGSGSIGEAVRERLEALGVDVVGIARRERERVRPVEELPDLLPRADALVVLTPLTPDTRGMIGAGELALLRDGALLVNAGRGAVVDTGALLAETASGRLRAVLDVVDPEPLPDDHPLWETRGVLAITPHLSGDSPASEERAARLAAEQLASCARGAPLANVVRDGASD